jgi:hypothetical protein
MPDLLPLNIRNLKIDITCFLSNVLLFRWDKFGILKGHKSICKVAAIAQPRLQPPRDCRSSLFMSHAKKKKYHFSFTSVFYSGVLMAIGLKYAVG